MARAFVTLGRSGESPPNPRAWLFRITSNLWIDHVRRRRGEARPARHERALDDAGGPSDAGPATDPKAAREAAATLLGQLAPRERAAVVLKDAFDLSLDEIAEALSTTTGAVKAALHRGRGKLAGQNPQATPSPPESTPRSQQRAATGRARVRTATMPASRPRTVSRTAVAGAGRRAPRASARRHRTERRSPRASLRSRPCPGRRDGRRKDRLPRRATRTSERAAGRAPGRVAPRRRRPCRESRRRSGTGSVRRTRCERAVRRRPKRGAHTPPTLPPRALRSSRDGWVSSPSHDVWPRSEISSG